MLPSSKLQVSFQTTYEELKLMHNRFEEAIEELPDYLWGIETLSWLLSKFPNDMLPDYLWGIETPARIPALYAMCKLPDYLWGIETSLRVQLDVWVVSFQTTYEELKPIETKSGTTVYVKGFQTTYEELKLNVPMTCNILFPLPDYLWGIETIRKLVGLSNAGMLPDYLWGIETKIFSYTGIRLDRKLPDYLWGIETIYHLSSRQSTWASRLPMRNWNDIPVNLGFRNGNIELPDYLWGIETSLTEEEREIKFSLPDYLWGIETL